MRGVDLSKRQPIRPFLIDVRIRSTRIRSSAACAHDRCDGRVDTIDRLGLVRTPVTAGIFHKTKLPTAPPLFLLRLAGVIPHSAASRLAASMLSLWIVVSGRRFDSPVGKTYVSLFFWIKASHSRMRATAMQNDSTVDNSCRARLRAFTSAGTTRAYSVLANFGNQASTGSALSSAPGLAHRVGRLCWAFFFRCEPF